MKLKIKAALIAIAALFVVFAGEISALADEEPFFTAVAYQYEGAPLRPTPRVYLQAQDNDRETYAEFIGQLRERLKNREGRNVDDSGKPIAYEPITISVSGIDLPAPSQEEINDSSFDDGVYDVMDLCKDLFAWAEEHTGEPTEGDYLSRQIAGQIDFGGKNLTPSETGNIAAIDFTYGVPYFSTREMEDKVDAAVASLLEELDLDGRDDYYKIRSVYDWICANIDYDHSADGLPVIHSAYAAIIDHKCVCQGYATLFYRLMLEEGVDCRYISGYGYSERHGWNIVRLGEKYYYADTTWDRTSVQNGRPYEYFLKSAGDFKNHRLDPDDTYFSSVEFVRQYPMTDASFAPVMPTGLELSPARLSMKPGETAALTASVLPEAASYKRVKWSSDNEAAATVKNGVVTAVGEGKATITAVTVDGGISAQATVEVAVPLDGVYAVELTEGDVPADGGRFYAEMTVTKLTDRDGEDVIVIAVYDGDELSEMAYMKAAMAKGQTVTFGGGLSAGAGSKVRAFVCESLDDLTKLSNIGEQQEPEAAL